MSPTEITPYLNRIMPEVRRLYLEEQLGTSEIGKRFGVSSKTIASRLDTEGLLKSRKNANINRRTAPDSGVIELYQEGVPVQDIVSTLGITYQSVYQVLIRNRIGRDRQPKGFPGHRVSKDQEDEICSLYLSGKSKKGITQELSISAVTVAKVLERRNIANRGRGVPQATLRHFYYGSTKVILMRSSWEAEIAGLFDEMGFEWQYEPRTFRLSDGHNYTPDFYLPTFDAYVEVKGGWTQSARARVNRFTTEYPKVTLFICRDPGWFGKLYLLQRLLEKVYGNDVTKMSDVERVRYIRDQALMLFAEIPEFLQEVPWKTHKKYDTPTNEERFLSELVDVLIFLLNLFAAYNADEQDIIRHMRTVEVKNFLRQKAGYTGSIGSDFKNDSKWQKDLEKEVL